MRFTDESLWLSHHALSHHQMKLHPSKQESHNSRKSLFLHSDLTNEEKFPKPQFFYFLLAFIIIIIKITIIITVIIKITIIIIIIMIIDSEEHKNYIPQKILLCLLDTRKHFQLCVRQINIGLF